MNPTEDIVSSFCDAPSGRILLTEFLPVRDQSRGSIVLTPPIADEMNRCRRFLSQLGRRLAAQGWHCVLPDLHGTGESEGEFFEATWGIWLDDLDFVLARHNNGTTPAILGLRAGCLLGNECLLRGNHELRRAIWVAPVLSGAQYLKQWLRVRVTAAKFAGRSESLEDLTAMLKHGQSVEVGGYALNPGLAAGLESASLEPSVNGSQSCERILVLTGRNGTVVPAYTKWLSQLEATGTDVVYTAVEAEAFWASQEVSCPPKWLDAIADTLS